MIYAYIRNKQTLTSDVDHILAHLALTTYTTGTMMETNSQKCNSNKTNSKKI